MKTYITHGIIVAISREASERGLKTDLFYDHDEWVLYIYKRGDSMRIDRNTKIGALEDWMQEQRESQ